MSQTSDLVRAKFTEGDNIRDAGLTTPEDIQRCDDIQYGPDPQWQVLDVYRPRTAQGQQFPAPLEDTNLVFAWVLTHGEEYGFDTGHVFGVGDSAGGHLLGLYANLCTNPAFAARFPFQPPEDFAPTAVALNCGVYQISTDGAGDELNRLLMADLMPEHGTPEELEGINVIKYITPQYPPTFFMTATGDFLQAQTPLLQGALMASSVPCVFRFYGDAAREPLGHVFHCNIKTEDAKRCNDEECAFFRSLL